MSNDGAINAAAGGERSAGQGCPLIGIQLESLFSQLEAIDNQDSLVGDNIIPGSPRGQRPGVIFAFGGDAAGHEGIILTNIQDVRLQSGSGQQSIAAVQFNRNALSEGNVFQFNGNSIFQDFVSMSDDGALDAAGEHRAGQVRPIFVIQRESLFIQFVPIDNQDRLVGDHIIPGSPGGQCPVCVSSLGSNAAGQETIAAGFYSLQGSRGQQSLVAV